jgi:hypothetical protein
VTAAEPDGRPLTGAGRPPTRAGRPLTRAELTDALGEVDDLVAAEILDQGATGPELEAALWLLERERRGAVPAPAGRETVRIAELLEALRGLDDSDDEPEYLGTD